jgi:copper chaperone CopZ
MQIKTFIYIATTICLTSPLASAKSTVSQSPPIEKVDPAEAEKGFLNAAGQSAKNYNKDSLHRLDFTVVGTGCAVCLMGIQTKLKTKPGVVKAAVMLKPPYGASVVYDAKQVTKDAIVDLANHQKKNVHVNAVTDTPITKIPIVLIPPHFKEGE